MQSFNCPKCQTVNKFSAQICEGCGVKFAYEQEPEITHKRQGGKNIMKVIAILL